MKSEERSVTLRNEGNALYKKGLNKQAIQKYFSVSHLNLLPPDLRTSIYSSLTVQYCCLIGIGRSLCVFIGIGYRSAG